MTAASISALLDDDHLDEAVAAQVARVKAAPADAGARMLFAELLCLTGAFERAETQLATLAAQDVTIPVAVARMRHFVRAALAREAWFNTGAVPALLSEPTEMQRLAIGLGVAIRQGDAAGTQAALQAAEAARAPLAGTADGAAFDDFRDVDDTSAYFLDFFTADGGYLWTDWSAVAGLKFEQPKHPIDLLWRQARMALRDGRVADIMIPAQYVAPAPTPAHRLGHLTDWRDLPGGAVAGTGQRVLLVGDDTRDILALTELRFA